jgi:hypothetical protein
MQRLGQLIVLIVVSLSFADAAETQGPKAHPYREHWKQSTFGKPALGGVVVKAAVGQMLDHPRNYGGGIAGFGKRLGAGFATHTVKTTVEHIVAAPLHEDLHYHRSTTSGFGPRLAHALTSTVVTSNTRTGKQRPAVGRLSGHAAAGIVSQVALHAGSGVATAGYGLAADAGMNVAREFWPRRSPRRQ